MRKRMLHNKKLALILDLDNTILHTIVASEDLLSLSNNIPELFAFRLDDSLQYYVKLRYVLCRYAHNTYTHAHTLFFVVHSSFATSL
jgi:predicted enzyme involved in methoxymalonyl-ACP biosynthesis